MADSHGKLLESIAKTINKRLTDVKLVKDTTYLIDTEKKINFTEGEMVPYDQNCPMAQVQATNHKHLFLTDTTDKFKQMSKENIDIQMDISMTSEYLEYHIEKTFWESYKIINQQIWKTGI